MANREHSHTPIGQSSAAAIEAITIEPNWSPKQTADWLGVSEPTLQRMRTDGSGPPYIKLGRRVLYRPSDLSRWRSEKVVSSTADAKERFGMSDTRQKAKADNESGLAA